MSQETKMVRTFREFCYLPHSTFPVPVLTAMTPYQDDNVTDTGIGPFVATKLQNIFDSRSFRAWLRETKVDVIDQISQKDVVVVPCSWILKTFSTKPSNSTEGRPEDSQALDKPVVGDFVVWVNNFMIAKVESISSKDVENIGKYKDYAMISHCQAVPSPIHDSIPRAMDEVQVPLNQLLSLSEFMKFQNMSKQTPSTKLVKWSKERIPMLLFPGESTLPVPPEANEVGSPASIEQQNGDILPVRDPTDNSLPIQDALPPLAKSKVPKEELDEDKMDWAPSETKEQKEMGKVPKSSEYEELKEQYTVVGNSKKNQKSNPGTSKQSREESGRKYPLKKIQVYGNCYMIDNKTFLHDLNPDEVNLDDLVIAKLTKYGSVGHVRRICRIIRFGKVKEIMVGIQFDEPLTDLRHFVEITHSSYVYSAESCAICRDNRWVFIDLDVLLNTENNVFVLQRQTSLKAIKKPIESIKFDIKYEAGRRESLLLEPISSQNYKINLGQIGIQGNYNSCYADSFFFSIFAFTSAFDQHIFKNLSNEGEKKKPFLIREALRNIIMYDIVNPLRNGSLVEWEAIQKFRNVLAEHFNPSFKDKMMDVEEFTLTLFEDILKVPGFFRYDTETTDHIHQIFASNTEPISPGSFPDLEKLLIESFKLSKVKLANIPNPGFLVKLPVYDGVPVFKRVFINPILSLENLLEKAEKKAFLHLRAVICLQNKHFTCFVRPSKDLKRKQPWIYFDSLPEDEKTFCVEIPDFDSKSGKEWANKLMSTCYLCIYENPSVTNEYKEEEQGEGTCV